MAERTVRNLEHLENTASTSRVLNLRAIARRKGSDPEYLAKPLFSNPALNTSIIVKHRLRAGEADLFTVPRQTATKVMIPIDGDDLRLGARFVFVGQRQFEEVLCQSLGVELKDDSPDLKTLRILDETPSLDPFLLREQLRRHDLEPAQCYFDLTDADTRRMFQFAQREIEPLVRMSLGELAKDSSHAATLTRKILANSSDAELEPLRLTLQLEKQQYQEGVFCWKAFLYYKWRLAELLPGISTVTKQLEATQPRGPQTDDLKDYLLQARANLKKTIAASCRSVQDTLAVYDAAYQSLTANGKPREFRDFLLKAPAMFTELGERLGAVDHIVSFWRFRFPSDEKSNISADDLAEIFLDFETSLRIERQPTNTRSRLVSTVLDCT